MAFVVNSSSKQILTLTLYTVLFRQRSNIQNIEFYVLRWHLIIVRRKVRKALMLCYSSTPTMACKRISQAQTSRSCLGENLQRERVQPALYFPPDVHMSTQILDVSTTKVRAVNTTVTVLIIFPPYHNCHGNFTLIVIDIKTRQTRLKRMSSFCIYWFGKLMLSSLSLLSN